MSPWKLNPAGRGYRHRSRGADRPSLAAIPLTSAARRAHVSPPKPVSCRRTCGGPENDNGPAARQSRCKTWWAQQDSNLWPA